MTIDKVKLERLKEIVSKLEKDGIDSMEEISFEFIMANCFPLIYDNIKAEMTKQYIKGFEDGMNKSQKKRGKKNEASWNN